MSSKRWLFVLLVASFILITVFLTNLPPHRITTTLPEYKIKLESGILVFHEDGYKGVLKTPLPDYILDRLVEAILFAFDEGAVRQIGSEDLDHAHLIIRPDELERNFANLDGILLHTQEFVAHSYEAYEKRNIFSLPDGSIEILPCTMFGHSARPMDVRDVKVRDCTIYASELGDVYAALFIVGVDHVLPKNLDGYTQNIRMIHEHKVLFGITELSGKLM